MNTNNETKSRLLASAKQEFMEKGYMTASLRSICRKADVTTGALYFFFKDKEDLFAALVEEPLNKLYAVMMSHYGDELQMVSHGLFENADNSADAAAAGQIIQYLYRYHDEFSLLLNKSQGSRFENCTDIFIQISEKHYRIMADRLSELYEIPKIEDSILHWLSHAQIDIFIQMITHNIPEQKAEQLMKGAVQFLFSGWFGMFAAIKKEQ